MGRYLCDTAEDNTGCSHDVIVLEDDGPAHTMAVCSNCGSHGPIIEKLWKVQDKMKEALKNTTPGKFYAFWKYDQWPAHQCCGGTIRSMRPDGAVELENYGVGNYFRPFLILPEQQGKERMGLLEQLKKDYDKELKALQNRYAKKHDELIKIPKD